MQLMYYGMDIWLGSESSSLSWVSSALCSPGREENGRLIWGLYSRVSDSEAPVWAGAREFGSDFGTSSPPLRRSLCRSAL
ncbi:unnamed protein product [Arctogadus glacialis]